MCHRSRLKRGSSGWAFTNFFSSRHQLTILMLETEMSSLGYNVNIIFYQSIGIESWYSKLKKRFQDINSAAQILFPLPLLINILFSFLLLTFYSSILYATPILFSMLCATHILFSILFCCSHFILYALCCSHFMSLCLLLNNKHFTFSKMSATLILFTMFSGYTHFILYGVV